MALQPVVADNGALASDLNQYRNHLQGASGATDAYHFRSSGGADFIITLADANGARKVIIRDSGGNQVGSIDSDGTFTGVVGTFTTSTITTATITELTAAALNILEYNETVETAADAGATYTIDMEDGSVHDITLTEACTLTFSNPASAGKATSFSLIVRQDDTGGSAVTWPASVHWVGGVAAVVTAAADAVDVFTFFTTDAGTTWYGFVSGQAMAAPA
jgi:hypothetical protein